MSKSNRFPLYICLMFAQKVLMIRPLSFGFNEEASATNSFQHNNKIDNLTAKVQQEFDSMVLLLKRNGIVVFVMDDTLFPMKPDAIFPNNWFSTHKAGKLLIYPMLNQNRRKERRKDIIEMLRKKLFYSEVRDFSPNENENKIVEGTGSLVFDHKNRICYAAISSRTNEELTVQICAYLNYACITFETADKNGHPVYHTNVMMCIGDKFCVACIACIKTGKEKLVRQLRESGKEIVEISYEEMEHFAGNMLFLKNESGENILVMSDTAFNKLEENKLKKLAEYAKIIHPKIPVIETIGGGSVRCMMAELF